MLGLNRFLQRKYVKQIVTRIAFVPLGLSLASAVDSQVLSKAPLYAGGGVQPNVLFLVDDSYSMFDRVMLTNGALKQLEESNKPGNGYKLSVIKELSGMRTQLDYSLTPMDISISPENILLLCPGVNALAYSPSAMNTDDEVDSGYLPWDGKENSNFYGAWTDPNNHNAGTLSLNSFHYVVWDDLDNDGEYDLGECGGTWSNNQFVVTSNNLKNASDLSETEKQNFANWYTYHSTRSNALKAALSHELRTLTFRAGLATLNSAANIGWGMNIADVDDVNNPNNTAARDKKNELIDILYKVNTNTNRIKFTPLRRALENAGLYFMVGGGKNIPLGSGSTSIGPESNFLPDVTKSPMLPADQGGRCQQNHTILVTDGYLYENGNQDKPRLNYGNIDQNTACPVGGNNRSDGASNMLADIAMAFYRSDLSTYPDDVSSTIDASSCETSTSPTSKVNWQHMVTHALSFGVKGNIDQIPENDTMAVDWPLNVSSLQDNPKSLDDLMHAAYNTRGEYISAADGNNLREAFRRLTKKIHSMSTQGTAAATVFNSASLTNDTMLFQGVYDARDWSGNLYAYTYTEGERGDEPVWDASALLEDRDAEKPRRIVTFNENKGVPFQVLPASSPVTDGLSELQLADLARGLPEGANRENYISDVIEVLRGDGDGVYLTDEAVFRDLPALGDIVHSSPQFVSSRASNHYPDAIEATKYSDYAKTLTGASGNGPYRAPMVYVGANDGMLHAFNAESGEEVFAYIPGSVFSTNDEEGMHWLVDKSYTHQPYVDGTSSVADVFVDNAWKTYLAGGLGRGGKAIYVLDITKPEQYTSDASAAENLVVTEFTDSTMGYSFSRPQMAKVEYDNEWVAVFGNGFGNDDDGQAYLYLLFLDGSGGGEKYWKVQLGDSGSVVDGSCENSGSDCNGLSSVTLLDLNNNGKLDRVYAGDLHGHIWVLDLTKNYHVGAQDVIVHKNDAGQPAPLFTACSVALVSGECPSASRQPITVKPVVVRHPKLRKAATAPNLMVLFGTGRYLSESDISDTKTQAFYGVWDAGEENGNLTPTNLTEQAITTSIETRSLSSNDVSYTVDTNYGWYMNLPATGERVISTPVVIDEVLIYSTLIPSSDICDRSGSGYLMGIDLSSGGATPFNVFPQRNTSGVYLDVPIGGLASSGDILIGAPTADGGKNKLSEERIDTGARRAPRRTSWSIVK